MATYYVSSVTVSNLICYLNLIIIKHYLLTYLGNNLCPECTCMGQRITCRRWFSSPTTWDLGIELCFSGLAESAFTCWAIHLAHKALLRKPFRSLYPSVKWLFHGISEVNSAPLLILRILIYISKVKFVQHGLTLFKLPVSNNCLKSHIKLLSCLPVIKNTESRLTLYPHQCRQSRTFSLGFVIHWIFSSTGR